jgi:ferredoxin
VRIVVDRERCIGAGLCVLTLPAKFDQSDEDGRVLFRGGEDIVPEQADAVRQAARVCPSGAVSLAGDSPAQEPSA